MCIYACIYVCCIYIKYLLLILNLFFYFFYFCFKAKNVERKFMFYAVKCFGPNERFQKFITKNPLVELQLVIYCCCCCCYFCMHTFVIIWLIIYIKLVYLIICLPVGKGGVGKLRQQINLANCNLVKMVDVCGMKRWVGRGRE